MGGLAGYSMGGSAGSRSHSGRWKGWPPSILVDGTMAKLGGQGRWLRRVTRRMAIAGDQGKAVGGEQKPKISAEGGVAQGPKGFPDVSVWRTIMVANEWSELQSERHTDVDFTLMFLLLFLAGLDLQYLATPQPNPQDLSPGETNAAVRFFVIIMWYLVIVVLQIGYRICAYRFLGDDPLDGFVDLCQLANVSVIILDRPVRGYYLHGRSVHSHAHVNMLAILVNVLTMCPRCLPCCPCSLSLLIIPAAQVRASSCRRGHAHHAVQLQGGE